MENSCLRCTGCPHGKRGTSCAEYKTARADPPSSKRIKREPEIKPESKIKPEIKEESDPFTIRGYFGIGE
tara:strand:+ start:30100 stop:30309 length:210 start_codon:yes stop_codon:yes gene_type:complete